MKRSLIVIITSVILMLTTQLSAHQWEVGFRVVNSSDQFLSGISIKIYSLNSSTRILEQLASFSSDTTT
jgi:hypothetical protein